MPVDSTGDAPALPTYRLHNNGKSGAPNHRPTTSLAIFAQMVSQGCTAEERGIGVGMCSSM